MSLFQGTQADTSNNYTVDDSHATSWPNLDGDADADSKHKAPDMWLLQAALFPMIVIGGN